MISPLRIGRRRRCSSHGWTVKSRGIESDHVYDIAAPPIPGRVGAKHELGRRPLHAADGVELREKILIQREICRFGRQQSCGDVRESAGRHHQHIGAEPREADVHARLDAAHHDGAGEDRGGAYSDRRDQKQRARLAPPEILQRKPRK
jgi:hypothetical protein